MAKKFFSKYTNAEIESILDEASRSSATPFRLYYDKDNKVYRFFTTEEKEAAYEKAYLAGDVAGKGKSKYEFTEPFTAPAPKSMTIDLSPTTRRYFIDSDNAITLSFKFTIKEGEDVATEPVDVYYTFDTPVGSTTITEMYAGETTQISLNIRKYLSTGDNTVTIVCKGRSSGASKTEAIVFHVLTLSLDSTFDVAASIPAKTNFSAFFTLVGSAITKTVEACVDGVRVATYSTTNITTTNREIKIQNMSGTYGAGKHTLQMRASMYVSAIGETFYTPTLIYEFVIIGGEQTNVMLEASSPPGPTIPADILLTAEQYVMTSITWGFFTSVENRKSGGSIRWELRKTSDQTTDTVVLMNEKTQLVENPNDRHQSPLQFIPSVVGTYQLHAIYEKDGMAAEDLTAPDGYAISITANSTGITEATNNMVLKLTAVGRSNDEPQSSLSSWSYTYLSGKDAEDHDVYTTYSARFFNQMWGGSNGWVDNALCIGNGATCRINSKPFAIDSGIVANGVVFEIDFETYNVNDDDAVLVTIGEKDEQQKNPYLQIKSQSATLVGSMGSAIVANFKKNERVKIAFVVYPNASVTYGRSLFAIINGVISQFVVYSATENFNIGRLSDTSTNYGMINIGNSNADAAIKIYNIRAYSSTYTFADGLANFLIDQSGAELTEAISRNNIYNNSQIIDYHMLQTRITTLLITGDLSKFLGGVIEADAVYAELALVSPDDPTINFTCNNAKLTIAGQSTRGKPVPSLHVKLQDPSENVVKDCDGVTIPTNRWAFRANNVPEKKFRLQANYMDSSCCHNAAFLKLYNNVVENVTLSGEHVLMTPAQKYAKSYDEYYKAGYKETMAATYEGKTDPTGNNWAFPYEMKMVPDSIPCVVMWKKLSTDVAYSFLGQYVIMDEKKSDFASCKRSIYDTVDVAGKPDPFKYYSSGGNRLWDNNKCRQIEIVETNNYLPFFISTSGWNTDVGGMTAHEKYFEMIYPDPDDISKDYTDGKSTKTVEDYWTEFKTSIVDKIAATSPQNGGSQSAFNDLYATGLLHRWHWASYYCLMLRNCCVDSVVKNIELTTYDGVTWIPKWWDVDMQCGLEQTAECDVPPRSNRNSEKDIINHVYYYDGRFYQNGERVSSWLWDALEGCPQFQEDVRVMDDALYSAGWTYDKLTEIQDNDYVKKWSESIYNESQMAKYLDVKGAADCAIYVQGDRTPHRHWFLKTSYDYYDAKNVCGDYKNIVVRMRTFGATTGNKISIVPFEDSYFAWGILNTPRTTGIVGKRNEPLDIVLVMEGGSATSTSNPLVIYNATKISKLDLSDIARTIQGEVYFDKATDNNGTNNITTLILGVSGNDVMSSSSGFNISHGYGEGLVGMSTMNRIDTFSVRGMFSFEKLSILGLDSMPELRNFYAAGTRLTEFTTARGAPLEKLELPTTILSLSLDSSTLTDANTNNCLIDWYHTNTGTADITTTVNPTFESMQLVVLNASGTPISLTVNVSDITFGVVDEPEKSNIPNMTIGAYHTTIGSIIPLNVVPSTVPASLKELSFTGMGGDIGAQKLVVDWVRAVDANPSYSFDNCKLTFRSMSWYGLQTADLMRIAKIPKENRSRFDGYIRCDAGATGFSTQEMNEIINAFGANVFNKNNSLCIDCNSNVVIISTETSEYVSLDSDGTINVIQGGVCTLKAAGFPLLANGITYWWGRMENNTETTGTIENPILHFGEHTLNCATGVISSVECYEPDSLYTFRVTKHVEGSSEFVTKTINVRIKARIYPNKSTIQYASPNPIVTNNVYQILNSGDYKFNTIFTNTTSLSFNGTLSSTNGGIWNAYSENPYTNYLELQPADAEYSDGKNADTQLVLRVKRLPDGEFNFSMRHTSNWKNQLKLLSEDYIYLCLATNISNILTIYEGYGNAAMFTALEKAGFEHGAPQSYNSQELKYLKDDGTLNMFELLCSVSPTSVDTFNHLSSATYDGSSKYNVVQFLKNVSTLNLSGCSGLCEYVSIWGDTYRNILNIDGTVNYRHLDMRGTGVGMGVVLGTNSSLLDIHYGSPKEIELVSPSVLNVSTIDVENTSYLNTLKLVNINGTTFKTYSKILSGGCPNLSSIAISSTGTAVETVSGGDIERITTKMKELTSRSSYSIGIRGSIHSQYAYTDSCCYLNGNFSEFHVTYDTRYIRWNDSRFEDYVADGIVGDGVGVTDARAARVTKLFGDIRGKADVTNLSDFDYFKSYVFSSYDDPLSSDFYGCTGITTITIPTTASHIGRYNFTTQPNLTNVALSQCTALSSIDTSAFVGCNEVISEFNMDGCSSTLVSADLRGVPNISLFQMNDGEKLQTLII